MPEPKIEDTRMYIMPSGQCHKQIFVECPICHKGKWSYLSHGNPSYPMHKSCSGLSGWNKPKSKENHSKAQIKRWGNEINRNHQRKVMIKWHHNKSKKTRGHRTDETKSQMRLSALKAYENPIVIEKHRIATLNRYKDPYEREATRKKNIKRYEDPEERRKTGERSKIMWSDQTFKNKTVRKMILGMQIKPNKPEILLINILGEYFPNQWEYIGDGGRDDDEFGGVVPDFINRENNLIIEHFGDYSHGKLLKKYHQTEQGRIEILAECGYKTLIFWEHEMKKMSKKEIADRVRVFMEAQ